MKISRFEDIEVWKLSRELVNMVYDLTERQRFNRDFGLKDQIQRAAVSCMSNVAEGFDSGSKAHFVQYLQYTRGSSSEVQSQLYVASDRKYITQAEFEKTYEKAKTIGKLANGFIKYLKGNRQTGQLANRPTGQPAN